MTFANHFIAGTLIAVAIKEPLAVIPLALASHYAVDALPHYGHKKGGYAEALKHRGTFIMEGLSVAGVVALLCTGVYGWNIVLLAALVANLPDAEWPLRYWYNRRTGKQLPETLLTVFHRNIQWCERPWGWIVEVVLFALGYVLLPK